LIGREEERTEGVNVRQKRGPFPRAGKKKSRDTIWKRAEEPKLNYVRGGGRGEASKNPKKKGKTRLVGGLKGGREGKKLQLKTTD